MKTPDRRESDANKAGSAHRRIPRTGPSMREIAHYLCRYLPPELRYGCDWKTLRRHEPGNAMGLAKEHHFSVRYLGQRILIRVSLGESTDSMERIRRHINGQQTGRRGLKGVGLSALPCYPVVIE